MKKKPNIFDLLLVLADGNISNLYNLSHQYSDPQSRGHPLIASVLRKEREGVLFPDKTGSGWCYVIRLAYREITLDLRLLPAIGFAEALMCDHPGLNAGPLLAYSSLISRNERAAKVADVVLRTNLTLLVRRGHRFTNRPRFYPELDNPITSKPNNKTMHILGKLWPRIFEKQNIA